MAQGHRFCVACGKEFVPEGNFCPFCGVRAGETEATHDGKTVGGWLEDLVSHDGGARAKALKAIG